MNPSYPAFPDQSGMMGIDARHYFTAHAPAKPWDEFRPVAVSRPVEPKLSDKRYALNERQKFILDDWLGGGPRPDSSVNSTGMSSFINDTLQCVKDCDEWRVMYEHQRNLQWPVYWADQMIAQLEKQ